MKRFSLFLQSFLLLCAMSTFACATPPLTMTIDGKLNDAAWQTAHAIDAFQTLKGQSPQATTRGWMRTDATYLYLAFRCDEPQMDKLQMTSMPRDGNLWTNDCIELFIAPFHSTSIFYHLIVDASGQVYDALHREGKEDTQYDLSITAKTQHLTNGWTLEMAIPLSNLALHHAAMPLMNFCRERKPVIENTSWHGAFAQPQTWRRVDLSLPPARSVSIGSWDFGGQPPQYGDNTATIQFLHTGNSRIKVLLYARQNQQWTFINGRPVSSPANRETQLALPYTLLAQHRPDALRWNVERGNVTLFSLTYRIHLPPNPLVATLQSSYYYASDHYAVLELQNFLAPASLQHSVLQITVKNPDGKVMQFKKIAPISAAMKTGLDISGWRQGEGAVFIELLCNHQIMAHQRLTIAKRPGPFG